MKQPIGPALPGTKQVLLAFDEASARSRNLEERIAGRGSAIITHCQHVNLPFLPKGLMLWGATNETSVHAIRSGNTTEVEIGGYYPVPGLYFSQGRSFDELVRFAEAGELDLAVEARQQLQMNEVCAGGSVSVSISGPYERFVVWGLTYTSGGPHRKAVIESLGNGTGFSARLDEVTLAGVQTVLDVTAPDAATAAQMLVGLESSRVHRLARGGF